MHRKCFKHVELSSRAHNTVRTNFSDRADEFVSGVVEEMPSGRRRHFIDIADCHEIELSGLIAMPKLA
jgi:hypothetical protein